MLRTTRTLRALFSAFSEPRAFQKSLQVKFTPHQVFDVVSDVARYSEFLPYVTGSDVIRRVSPHEFEARLGVGFNMYSESYTSRVTLDPHQRITSQAIDSSIFSTLTSTWDFSPRDGGCLVQFSLEYVVSNPLLKIAIDASFPEAAEMQVAALERRCASLYPAGIPSTAHPPAAGKTDSASYQNLVETFSALRRFASSAGISDAELEKAFRDSTDSTRH